MVTREPPTRRPPALERDHKWVQDESNEPPHQHEEHHVPQSIQQFAQEIDGNHDGDRDQNRRNGTDLRSAHRRTRARLEVVSGGGGSGLFALIAVPNETGAYDCQCVRGIGTGCSSTTPGSLRHASSATSPISAVIA